MFLYEAESLRSVDIVLEEDFLEVKNVYRIFAKYTE